MCFYHRTPERVTSIFGIGKGSHGVGSVLSDCTPYVAAIREVERGNWERPHRDLPPGDVETVLLPLGGQNIRVQVVLHTSPVTREHLLKHGHVTHGRAPVLQRA